jgi:hypothetical protein
MLLPLCVILLGSLESFFADETDCYPDILCNPYPYLCCCYQAAQRQDWIARCIGGFAEGFPPTSFNKTFAKNPLIDHVILGDHCLERLNSVMLMTTFPQLK